jgi:hypothetical protein
MAMPATVRNRVTQPKAGAFPVNRLFAMTATNAMAMKRVTPQQGFV